MLETELLAFVKKLTKDISSLPEYDMRVQLLGRRLADLEPEDAANALNTFYDKAANHIIEFRKAKSVMADPKEVIAVIGEEKG